MSYIAWLHGTVCHASDVDEVMMSHNVYSVCGDHILFLWGLHLDASSFDNLVRSSGGYSHVSLACITLPPS